MIYNSKKAKQCAVTSYSPLSKYGMLIPDRVSNYLIQRERVFLSFSFSKCKGHHMAPLLKVHARKVIHQDILNSTTSVTLYPIDLITVPNKVKGQQARGEEEARNFW